MLYPGLVGAHASPVRENLRLSEAARDPVFVDNDRVVVADPQPLALPDARVGG